MLLWLSQGTTILLLCFGLQWWSTGFKLLLDKSRDRDDCDFVSASEDKQSAVSTDKGELLSHLEEDQRCIGIGIRALILHSSAMGADGFWIDNSEIAKVSRLDNLKAIGHLCTWVHLENTDLDAQAVFVPRESPFRTQAWLMIGYFRTEQHVAIVLPPWSVTEELYLTAVCCEAFAIHTIIGKLTRTAELERQQKAQELDTADYCPLVLNRAWQDLSSWSGNQGLLPHVEIVIHSMCNTSLHNITTLASLVINEKAHTFSSFFCRIQHEKYSKMQWESHTAVYISLIHLQRS